MKQCPYCLSEIKEKAKKCSQCGEWVIFWSGSRISALVTIVIILGAYAALTFFSSSVSKIANSYSEGREFDEPVDKRFKFLSHEKIEDGASARIVGEIQNTGPLSKEFISIEVRFFDKDNKTIDVSQDYLNGDFAHNEIRPFKVAFGGCGDSKPTKSFDHYEIKIRR